MKRVTIRQAILDAIDQSDEFIGRYPNQLLKWAKYIEKEIGSLNGYKFKSKAFTITGTILDLPDDCYRVIAVLRGNWENETNAHYRQIGDMPIVIDEVSDEISYVWMPENTTQVMRQFWEEIGDQLQLVNEFDGQELTLVYQYIETDENGFWLINESHLDAITKFLLYKIAYKFRWKIFKSDKLLRPGHQMMVKDLERDYNIAIRHARAEDGRESEFERAQI